MLTDSSIPERLPQQTAKGRRLFLTADEHYFHRNIIRFQNRPFEGIVEMNAALIDNHNAVVSPTDHVIHVGDMCLSRQPENLIKILKKLNGRHYLMDGSHDVALKRLHTLDEIPAERNFDILPKLFEFTYNKVKIVLCHYAMAKWWASHHGSVHFYGHSHGHFNHPGRAMDIGVDCHDYKPVLIEDAINAVIDKPIGFPITQQVTIK